MSMICPVRALDQGFALGSKSPVFSPDMDVPNGEIWPHGERAWRAHSSAQLQLSAEEARESLDILRRNFYGSQLNAIWRAIPLIVASAGM